MISIVGADGVIRVRLPDKEYLQHADKHGTLLISFTAFIVVGARN
jgi:hypothetical protein